jgi:flagellar basal-body rod protein FlgF
LSEPARIRAAVARHKMLGNLCPRRRGLKKLAKNTRPIAHPNLARRMHRPPWNAYGIVTAMIDNASSVALSGQLARDRQMDVLANNIANLSTTAFKGEEMVFATLVSSASGTAVRYVQDVGTARDWSQGPLTRTGNALDVALQGQGFLEVQTAQGIRYTRDGRLKLDATGQLVTLEGNAVLGDGASPIAVPPGTTDITIGEDGTLTTPTGSVGKLAVVNFDSLQAVSAETDGLYATEQAATPATDAKVEQGMVEGSNVQAITEMTRLMQASRAVGMAKTFQDNESDRHKSAIDRLAKTV